MHNFLLLDAFAKSEATRRAICPLDIYWLLLLNRTGARHKSHVVVAVLICAVPYPKVVRMETTLILMQITLHSTIHHDTSWYVSGITRYTRDGLRIKLRSLTILIKYIWLVNLKNVNEWLKPKYNDYWMKSAIVMLKTFNQIRTSRNK